MMKFTLESGLEESQLELQSAFKTLYEAMISADEQEVLIRSQLNEGAEMVDKLTALHEANLESLKNAIKSIWSWLCQKVQAFTKLIKEWYGRMRKKLQEYLALRNINFDVEIEWYTNESAIFDRLSDINRALGFNDFSKIDELTSNIDQLLSKKSAKASEIFDFKDKTAIKHTLEIIDSKINNSIKGNEKDMEYARSEIERLDKNSDNLDQEAINNARKSTNDAIKALTIEKRIIMDMVNSAFKALVKMGMKHTPEQDAKYGAKNEAPEPRLDADMLYECVCYEFDHIMDDCYVLPTGDLVNGMAA